MTRFNSSSFFNGAAIYLAASIINALIPFVLLPVLTRYLEPSEYGEVAIFQVWVSLIGALCGLSVHGAAVRKYYDYDEPDKEIGPFIFSCIAVLCISTLFVFFLILPFLTLISNIVGLSEKWLIVGVVVAFFNFLMRIRLGQWQVSKNPKFYGMFQISASLLDMFLSLLLVVFFTLGVAGRISGYSSAVVIFGLGSLLLLKRNNLLRPSWRPDLMIEALRFGVPLVPHVIGAFLLITVDRAVIGSQVGLEQAGYYMVAVQFAMVMSLVLDSINKAYTPWLYERLSRDDLDQKLHIVKITYIYGFFLFLCVFFAFSVGDSILIFIAGDKYAPAGDLVGWLVLAKAFHGMYYMVCSYIFYTKKTAIISRLTISTGLINVGLLFVLTDFFGLVGAAWAMCISMLLQWILTWFFAARLVYMPWSLRIL